MLLFAILALPPTLVSIIASFDAHREMMTRIRENTEHFALLASTYERTLIDQSESLLANVAREAVVRAVARDSPPSAQCSGMLRAAIEPYPIYASMMLVGIDGVPLCSSNSRYFDINVANRDWFIQAVRSKTTFLSSLVIVRGPEVPGIVLAQPLSAPDGVVEAVLAIGIDLAELQPFERFQG
ncbi:MAG: PDC sensor domain-containing protein, partial [Woeseiaceae bacterium]